MSVCVICNVYIFGNVFGLHLHLIFFIINVFVMKKPWQRLQDASRELPEKLSTSTPRAKAALNAKDGHTKCWFNLIDKENLFILIVILQHFYTSNVM